MKKIFLFIFLSLIFISLVSAGTWSYDNSKSYGSATAYVKLTGMYPECDGTVHGDYCAGKWYIDLSFTGDKFYIKYKASEWMQPSSSGYSGGTEISDGRIYLNENGLVPKYIICAWDYNKASNGDWAWTGQCGGYLGAEYLDNKKTIKCYDSKDCSTNEYCNKDGEWKDWNCIIKQCNIGEEKCIGFNTQICDNYNWKNNGIVLNKCGVECTISQEKCIDSKQFICNNNKWVEQVYIIGKCGVECISKSDCPVTVVEEQKCSENNITIKSTSYSCESNKCIQKIENNIIQICQYSCLSGSCQTKIINKIDIYRLENNECIKYNILENEKLLTDYSTLTNCLEDVVLAPIVVDDIVEEDIVIDDILKELNIFEKIWNSIINWWTNLFS